MVRSEAALRNALEQFRFLLAVPPDDPVEPAAVVLPEQRSPGDRAAGSARAAGAFDEPAGPREMRDQVEDAPAHRVPGEAEPPPAARRGAWASSQIGLRDPLRRRLAGRRTASTSSSTPPIPWTIAADRRQGGGRPRPRGPRALGAAARAGDRLRGARGGPRPRPHRRRASSCRGRRWRWPRSSAGSPTSATSAASPATSTWWTRRAASSWPAAPSWACSRLPGRASAT